MFISRRIRQARISLARASNVFVLTGAGLSVASDIPPFRGKGGLWGRKDLVTFAFPEALHADPANAWSFYEQARVRSVAAEPNAGHRAIHGFAATKAVHVFTQNVDGLHAKTGTDAKEIHGSLLRYRCLAGCRMEHLPALQPTAHLPVACPHCQSFLRHDVVLFGETVRYSDAFRSDFHAADVILLVGTSGLVTNTRILARQASKLGKTVIEVNPAWITPATLWTTVTLRERAEDVLPELLS